LGIGIWGLVINEISKISLSVLINRFLVKSCQVELPEKSGQVVETVAIVLLPTTSAGSQHNLTSNSCYCFRGITIVGEFNPGSKEWSVCFASFRCAKKSFSKIKLPAELDT
jgi:hypothetical protein